MSRATRILEILELYDESHHRLRATDVVARLGVSLATAYRCLADLEAFGLIESAGAGCYVLGPAIVELDRQIRTADPLIAAASDVAQTLSARTRGTVLLCRLHGLKVLCVDTVTGPSAPWIVGYERGRAMSLYRGATSKAILAHLPDASIRKLIKEDRSGLRHAGLPTEFEALRSRLAAMCEHRVQTSAGEVNPQARGWAVPVFHGAHLLGSLSVVRGKDATAEESARIADQLHRAGLRIEARLEEGAHARHRA